MLLASHLTGVIPFPADSIAKVTDMALTAATEQPYRERWEQVLRLCPKRLFYPIIDIDGTSYGHVEKWQTLTYTRLWSHWAWINYRYWAFTLTATSSTQRKLPRVSLSCLDNHYNYNPVNAMLSRLKENRSILLYCKCRYGFLPTRYWLPSLFPPETGTPASVPVASSVASVYESKSR